MKLAIGAMTIVCGLAAGMAGMSGCTRLPVRAGTMTVATDGQVRVSPENQITVSDAHATTVTAHTLEMRYFTCLQDRSLTVDRPGWGKLDYSTSNDPVVRLATILSQMAEQAAKPGAGAAK